MSRVFADLPLKIGASSMIFGNDMVRNAKLLAKVVDHVEIVLFHTPDVQNIPGNEEIRRLNEIRREYEISYSVHLPASLEIGSSDRSRRKNSVRLISEICLQISDLDPFHYILHIPFSPPTLVPTPGLYFKSGNSEKWNSWTRRSMDSLTFLKQQGIIPEPSMFLVENINYSPRFLRPFIENGLCRLCLDVGHLILGGEPVNQILEENLNVVREIHVHGVAGNVDHLCLSHLPESLLGRFFRFLCDEKFDGIVNMEVFSPEDLYGSIAVLLKILDSKHGYSRKSCDDWRLTTLRLT